MDCPRGLPTFFQYGAGTSGAGPAPRVPAPGAAPARPGAGGRHPKLAALPARLMRRRGDCYTGALLADLLGQLLELPQ